ncbi:MAG: hypothetical protein R3E83_19290 [Burkholderiaceae bacterium]
MNHDIEPVGTEREPNSSGVLASFGDEDKYFVDLDLTANTVEDALATALADLGQKLPTDLASRRLLVWKTYGLLTPFALPVRVKHVDEEVDASDFVWWDGVKQAHECLERLRARGLRADAEDVALFVNLFGAFDAGEFERRFVGAFTQAFDGTVAVALRLGMSIDMKQSGSVARFYHQMLGEGAFTHAPRMDGRRSVFVLREVER